MPYVPFYEKFPEIAKRETRSVLVLNDPNLPEDEYGLLELYCDEPGCDCRRVFFDVYSQKQNKSVAVITYGWESKQFYVNWFGKNTPSVINELKGPALNATSPQSKLAPALLRLVTNVLKDKHYVARLKRHYAMFRKAVDEQATEERPKVTPAVSKRIPRNGPCPCGSGKKYKKCCGSPK
ncbi:MAG: SEC-C domain-containing protein [Anaerolineae bacterium]|nr:SEC-C domain-containing protein [Anaerolineae bacterium]